MMIPNEIRRESTQLPAITEKKDGDCILDGKKEDWLTALERELQDIERKWPGAQKAH